MQIFRNKIAAIFLIPAVLLSSLSFRIDKHICEDELTGISYFVETDDCCMQERDCSTPDEMCTQNESVGLMPAMDDCCRDIEEFIPANTFQSEPGVKLSKLQVHFILSFTSVFLKINLYNFSPDRKLNTYLPPCVLKDIAVLFQVFRI